MSASAQAAPRSSLVRWTSGATSSAPTCGWTPSCARKSIRSTATRDTELADRPVPKGAFVSAMFCVTHLDPDVWESPEDFRPRRHLEGKPAPYSLTPFGGGVRRCLGAPLAQHELEVALREVLSRRRPEPAGRLERGRLHGVTIVPVRGGRVVLRDR